MKDFLYWSGGAFWACLVGALMTVLVFNFIEQLRSRWGIWRYATVFESVFMEPRYRRAFRDCSQRLRNGESLDSVKARWKVLRRGVDRSVNGGAS